PTPPAPAHEAHPLDAIFRPRSAAVVGASASPGNAGMRFVRALQTHGFAGPIYPVNPGGADSVAGLPAYRRVGDCPGPVDHVISAAPWHTLPALVQDCVQKGVRSLHLFTARLAETGLPDRIEMERRIVAEARAGGLRIIGPNCMGLYVPAAGVSFRSGLPREAGAVGYFSQSGGNTVNLAQKGAGRGLRFSKVISYGNAADINECDLLDYLLWDPDTRVICAYIEGVKDGRRFFELLRGARKPVIVLKGGETAAGARMVTSHTASLASSEEIWRALEAQTGVIRVHSMEELADAALAFSLLPPATGRRVAVLGGGGGESVAGADACEREGLPVPPLPEALRAEFTERFPEVGMMLTNPLDSSVTAGPVIFGAAARALAGWEGVDLLLGNAGIEWALDGPDDAPNPTRTVQGLIEAGRSSGKPLAVVIGWLDTQEQWKWEASRAAQETAAAAGVPVYPSTGRAAAALRCWAAYGERPQE
ncbi:MAG: CoA-binding protein, partial [Chloroflexi bacterium]|nr:CoA-binding protein [Chloroflexota bacterium]